MNPLRARTHSPCYDSTGSTRGLSPFSRALATKGGERCQDLALPFGPLPRVARRKSPLRRDDGEREDQDGRGDQAGDDEPAFLQEHGHQHGYLREDRELKNVERNECYMVGEREQGETARRNDGRDLYPRGAG